MAKAKTTIGQLVFATFRGAGRLTARFGRALVLRSYALAMMAIIMWATFGALRYLIVSLAAPSQTPAQIAGIPKRLDETVLVGARPDWLGLTSAENPRGPLAHYHRFETWIRADRFNDCTRSGCHGPLPHAEKKETRAFLNMHATTLHCGVCHMDGQKSASALVWYDLDDGEPRSRPALLDAQDWLDRHDSNASAEITPADQSEIVRLLNSAAAEGQGEPYLERIARDVSAVRADSESMRPLLEQAREAVRRALRGSYGAKLARSDAAGRPILGYSGSESASKAWIERGANATGEERDRMLAAVHPDAHDPPIDCTNCHQPTPEAAFINFSAAGYPAARVRALTDAPIFEMIQHIREGRPFYLPTVGKAESNPAP